MHALHALFIVGCVAASFGATASPVIAETREEALKKKAAEDLKNRSVMLPIAHKNVDAYHEYMRLKKLDPAAAKAYKDQYDWSYNPQKLNYGNANSKSPLGLVTGKHENLNMKGSKPSIVGDKGSGGISNWSGGGHSTGPGAKTAADQNRFRPVHSLGVKPSDPGAKR